MSPVGLRPARLLPVRRGPRIAVITAAGVLALTVAGDRVARVQVEHRLAARASCVLDAGDTSAALRSPTTLPEIASGDLGTVDVRAHDVRRFGVPVDVAATLDGVHTDGRVAATEATVTVPYRAMQRRFVRSAGSGGGRLDVTGLGGDGRYLVVHATLSTMHVPVTVTMSVTSQGDSLTVTPVDLLVLGHSLPVAEIEPLLSARDPGAARALAPRTIRLPHLPRSAELGSVSPHAGGLSVQVHTGRLDGGRAAATHCS